jgi:hypothetical protein
MAFRRSLGGTSFSLTSRRSPAIVARDVRVVMISFPLLPVYTQSFTVQTATRAEERAGFVLPRLRRWAKGGATGHEIRRSITQLFRFRVYH